MTRDDNAALVAAPAKTSLRGVAPPLPIEPIPNTKMAVMIAPTNANQMYWLAVLILKKEIPQTTNSAAPVFTPNMLGSAMGLRVTDCIKAPETPKCSTTHNTKYSSCHSLRERHLLHGTVYQDGINHPISSFHPTIRDPKASEANTHYTSKMIERYQYYYKIFW